MISQNPFEVQQGIEEYTFDLALNYLDEKTQRYKFSHPLYKQEYYLLCQKGSKFLRMGPITWERVKEMPLCLYPSETHVFDPHVYEIIGEPAPGQLRVETNAMMVLLDHVRSGKWASILPKPVLFMVAGNDEFEVAPLPRSKSPGTVGLIVPQREPACHLAEAFFHIATSPDVLETFNEFFERKPVTARKPLVRA